MLRTHESVSGAESFDWMLMQEPPSIAKMEELTEKWQPYRSLGSYYMWHALSVEKQEQNAAKFTGTPKKKPKKMSAPIPL